jgi:hypothetical protein
MFSSSSSGCSIGKALEDSVVLFRGNYETFIDSLAGNWVAPEVSSAGS